MMCVVQSTKIKRSWKAKTFWLHFCLIATRVGLLNEAQEIYRIWNVCMMVVSCTEKTIKYFFTKNKVIMWHWNILLKNCVKMDNVFCYFMLFTGVIFLMFCTSVSRALFIGNGTLKFCHIQLYILLHLFVYSSCKLTSTLIFFSSLLTFLKETHNSYFCVTPKNRVLHESASFVLK